MGKDTGRNASEPGCSLVNYAGDADPVVRRGRPPSSRTDNGQGLGGSPGVAGMACIGRKTMQSGRPVVVASQNGHPDPIRQAPKRDLGYSGIRRGAYDRLRVWDNITRLEERRPTLFTQPTSGGSGDCHHAINASNDQDTTEEALSQGQAGSGFSLLRPL
jgi:hypothetical protein